MIFKYGFQRGLWEELGKHLFMNGEEGDDREAQIMP